MTKFGLLVSLVLTLCVCSCYEGDHNHVRNHLRRGLSGEPATLDPAAATDSFSLQIIGDLYEGLAVESPNGGAVAGAASSWTVSQDGKEFTFALRPDGRWSNGTPVRAENFVTAFRRVVDPKNGLSQADDLRVLVNAAEIIAGRLPISSLGIRAVSDTSLIMDLVRPTPYLPQLLTHASTFPIYSDESARSHLPGGLISNGAYTLVRWTPGSAIRLTKNTRYWNSANVQISDVDYEPVSDDNSQLARYRSGQLDVTDTVPTNAAATLRGSAELVTSPFLATAYYGLNLRAGPLANSPELRKALAMSIDRERLVQSLGFGQEAAYGFLPPGTWDYSIQSFPWRFLTSHDRLSQARELYARAGYGPENVLRLRLLYNSNPVIRQTAVLVASMWKEALGVETDLSEEEFKVFLQSRRDSGRWDVARLGWVADFNDASNFLNTLRRNSTNNDEGYSNPRFESLLDEATSADPVARRHSLEEAERTMLTDYPIVPIYFFVSKRMVKPYVHGVHPSPLDKVPTSALSMGDS